MNKLLAIHGPNLDLLGTREPQYYGTESLATLNRRLCQTARRHSMNLDTFQSNAEHALIDRIQQASSEAVEFIVINPAALAHTSIALRDALLAVAIPFIEVHISNIYARESFRYSSYLRDAAVGTITGLGTYGYELALQAAVQHIKAKEKEAI